MTLLSVLPSSPVAPAELPWALARVFSPGEVQPWRWMSGQSPALNPKSTEFPTQESVNSHVDANFSFAQSLGFTLVANTKGLGVVRQEGTTLGHSSFPLS